MAPFSQPDGFFEDADQDRYGRWVAQPWRPRVEAVQQTTRVILTGTYEVAAFDAPTPLGEAVANGPTQKGGLEVELWRRREGDRSEYDFWKTMRISRVVRILSVEGADDRKAATFLLRVDEVNGGKARPKYFGQ